MTKLIELALLFTREAGMDHLWSIPNAHLSDCPLFATFEPITLAAAAPPWATRYFRYREAEPVMVPQSFTQTWFEGRWSGRTNTTTYPKTISLWFESEDDVVLAKLAGLPLSEKVVSLKGRSLPPRP